MRLRETPVPIPNTTVKTQAADGTLPGTARESRWLPDFLKRKPRGFYIDRMIAMFALYLPEADESGQETDVSFIQLVLPVIKNQNIEK